MERKSVVELIKEIYVDVNYMGVSNIIIKHKFHSHEEIHIITVDNDGIQPIMDILEHHIHPRYTRVIIDGGNFVRVLGDWIDDRYNFKMLPQVIGDPTYQTILLELVEVREATKEDIKEWEELISELKGERE